MSSHVRIPAQEPDENETQVKSTNCKYVICAIVTLLLVAAIIVPLWFFVIRKPDDQPIPICGFQDPSESYLSPFYADKVLNVSITITPENWDKLRFERRSMSAIFSNCNVTQKSPYNYYPASVSVNGKKFNKVGLRTKGLIGSINPLRPSLKVKLQKYDKKLIYEDKVKGEDFKRFTFNNQNQDLTRITATFSYYVFRTMGVPAPRANFAHIQVNGKSLGVYDNVEPIKTPLLARCFCDPTGNLYEGSAQDLRKGYTKRIEKHTHEKKNDWSDINELIEIIEASDDVFKKKIGLVLDKSAFIRYSIVESMILHVDGFGANANNWYLYHDPKTGKFFFIPWGADATLSYDYLSWLTPGSPNITFSKSLLTRRMYQHFGSEYRDMMRTLLNERWDTTAFLAKFDSIVKLIRPYYIANMTQKSSRTAVDGALAKIRTFIETQKKSLLAELNGPILPLKPQFPPATCLKPMGDITVDVGSKFGAPFTAPAPARGIIKGSFNGTLYNLSTLSVGMQMVPGTGMVSFFVFDFTTNYMVYFHFFKKNLEKKTLILGDDWVYIILQQLVDVKTNKFNQIGFITPPGKISFGGSMRKGGNFTLKISGRLSIW